MAADRFLNLDYGGIGIRYSGGSLNIGPVTAALTDTAAGQLNAAFGTTALSSSTVLGEADSLPAPPSREDS